MPCAKGDICTLTVRLGITDLACFAPRGKPQAPTISFSGRRMGWFVAASKAMRDRLLATTTTFSAMEAGDQSPVRNEVSLRLRQTSRRSDRRYAQGRRPLVAAALRRRLAKIKARGANNTNVDGTGTEP